MASSYSFRIMLIFKLLFFIKLMVQVLISVQTVILNFLKKNIGKHLINHIYDPFWVRLNFCQNITTKFRCISQLTFTQAWIQFFVKARIDCTAEKMLRRTRWISDLTLDKAFQKIRTSRNYVVLKAIWSYCTLRNIKLEYAHVH